MTRLNGIIYGILAAYGVAMLIVVAVHVFN